MLMRNTRVFGWRRGARRFIIFFRRYGRGDARKPARSCALALSSRSTLRSGPALVRHAAAFHTLKKAVLHRQTMSAPVEAVKSKKKASKGDGLNSKLQIVMRCVRLPAALPLPRTPPRDSRRDSPRTRR